MGEREPAPGSSGDEPGNDSDVQDDAREAALMREVLRAQERHREGGVNPELEVTDQDPEPAGRTGLAGQVSGAANFSGRCVVQ